MDSLDIGKDKIRKLCEILKQETLEPAHLEAKKILEAAEHEARTLIREAEARANQIVQSAVEKTEKQKELFESSLKQACRQGVESLKQEIENQLLNLSLTEWIEQGGRDASLAAKLINALVMAIEKEGTSADFSAMISTRLSPEEINRLLLKTVLDKLREKSVVVGDFEAGVQLKLHDKHLTLDLSEEALKELIGQYVRKDFRALLFAQ